MDPVFEKKTQNTDRSGTPMPWTVTAGTTVRTAYSRKGAEKVVETLLDAAYRLENPLAALQIIVLDSRPAEALTDPAEIEWRKRVGGPAELIRIFAPDRPVRTEGAL